MLLWLTSVGLSPYAVINTLWAAKTFENIAPSHIILLNNGDRNPKIAENVDLVRTQFERLCSLNSSEQCTIKCVSVDEDDINLFKNTIQEIVERQDYSDWDIVLDMTPGRKYMSAIIQALGFNLRQQSLPERSIKIYYLHLMDNRYQNVPFPFIPFGLQRLVDILKEVKG